MQRQGFEIIPVLDVARGKVVRGVKGERASYRDIATPLAKTSDPADVARGYVALYPFRTLYVADLDGIEGRGRNVHLVPAISAAVPIGDIWIDAGSASRKAARSVLAAPVATLVAGSESVETLAEIADILKEAPVRTVLSLDFRANEFMGPPELLSASDLWPDRVIVMTLARVGSGEGPDLERIGEIVRRGQGRRVYAAGGVRGKADIEALREVGASGALIASAIHDGVFKAHDIRSATGRR